VHRATDPSEGVLVSLDTRGRLAGVQMSGLPDELRRPEALATAVDRAFRRAVLAEHPSRARGDGPPPPARRGPANPPRPVREDRSGLGPSAATLERQRVHAADRLTGIAPAEPDLTPTGLSANECVRVTLHPAGSNGRVEVDAGWLSQAPAQKVAAAVTEAFAAAYERRDR
jgi:hypothetical protein